MHEAGWILDIVCTPVDRPAATVVAVSAGLSEHRLQLRTSQLNQKNPMQIISTSLLLTNTGALSTCMHSNTILMYKTPATAMPQPGASTVVKGAHLTRLAMNAAVPGESVRGGCSKHTSVVCIDVIGGKEVTRCRVAKVSPTLLETLGVQNRTYGNWSNNSRVVCIHICHRHNQAEWTTSRWAVFLVSAADAASEVICRRDSSVSSTVQSVTGLQGYNAELQMRHSWRWQNPWLQTPSLMGQSWTCYLVM